MEDEKNLVNEEDSNLDESDLEDEETEEQNSEEEQESDGDEKSTDGSAKGEQDSKGKKQSRGENRHFKELRELKKKNDELQNKNALLEKEKNEAVFSSKAGRIPDDVLDALGLEKIEDDEDLALANAYLEADKQGKSDPVMEAYKSIRERAKTERAKESNAEAQRQAQLKKVEEDKKSFISKYGQEAFDKAMDKNGRFMKLFGPDKDGNGLLGYGNMTELYARFMSIEDDGKSKDKGKEMGAIPDPSSGTNKPMETSKMSDEEFDKYFKNKYGGQVIAAF